MSVIGLFCTSSAQGLARLRQVESTCIFGNSSHLSIVTDKDPVALRVQLGKLLKPLHFLFTQLYVQLGV